MSRSKGESEDGAVSLFEESGTWKETFDAGCESTCSAADVSEREYDEATVTGRETAQILSVWKDGVDDMMRKVLVEN